MSSPVSYELQESIGVITVDSPPVNALSHAVRVGIMDGLEQGRNDDGAQAIVLICAGRTFIAGADITEFDKPMQDPWLPTIVTDLESTEKPVIAAIHGTALGGGLETALGCHYRCAVPSAKVGLPEVLLGLLPGASGTQRLPRLIGAQDALDAMISGKPMPAAVALEKGAIDKIIEGDLREGAIDYAKSLVAEGVGARRISEMQVPGPALDDGFFAEYRQGMARATRGFFAPERIVQCVEGAVNLPFEDGLARERQLFDDCKKSTHSQSQRHLFFAEREVAKIPDIGKDTPRREINKVAIIGAGTMGGGIAMNFVNAGIPVTVLEVDQDGLDRGLGIVRKNYESSVKKGRLSDVQLSERMGLIAGTLSYDDLADADLVIEAVFENMEIKKKVFAQLDNVCKPGAILASNTSTLDVDAIAAVTTRPEDVIGLHFFSPANVMVLLEIVRGVKTAKDVVATAMAMSKTIRKVGVLVGVCFGFAGNRMFIPYVRESQSMLLEGVKAERIDQVSYDWGMAMGPSAVQDLAGIDVFYKLNQEWADLPDDPAFCRVLTVLAEKGWYGQKTGRGMFKYDDRRKPSPDPEVEVLIAEEAKRLGVEQRDISDDEIIQRLFYAMINEGALILAEGIALRPSDIDVIFVNGYGFPRYRGGPMFYADSVGVKAVYDRILEFRERYGDSYWTPAPLLEELALAGKTFGEWAAAR